VVDRASDLRFCLTAKAPYTCCTAGFSRWPTAGTSPHWLELEIRARDKHCVYCGVRFGLLHSPRQEQASWEHIVNDARIITRENIALCCVGCNASKGAKDLEDWLMSSYCLSREIDGQSVAPVVQAAIQQRPCLLEP